MTQAHTSQGHKPDSSPQAATPGTRLAGHALVEALVAQGVDTVFGVPGESYLAVLDGFHEFRDQIRFIACRQEGGAAFMAEAQGKLSGQPGICFVTRGPGATNASIGLHTAFQDSTPMILFIGQVASDQRDREAFQEVDYRHMFGPGTLGMAKWVGEVHDADRLPEYVAHAFHTAMQGRPGPVVLVLPEDEGLWITQTEQELILHHCAYWMSLRGQPPRTNRRSVRVEIPRANIFSMGAFQNLMEQIKRGEFL